MRWCVQCAVRWCVQCAVRWCDSLCSAVACAERASGWWWVPPTRDELRTGERAVVRFRFIKHPEYLRVGAKLLFREGVTKGIGHVTPGTMNVMLAHRWADGRWFLGDGSLETL
uniref:Uncharacterized protein n=1 Tax=Salarias fasciatus TaxID=181472 RepID=A0A672FDT2_SALFA